MRCYLILLLLGLLLSNRAGAQRVQLARLEECVELLAPDSVAMYYDATYLLTPRNCATIRRLARLDSSGNFHGRVLDYRLTDNTLQYKLHYAYGQLTGPVEIYHANGQLAAQGQFLQGQRLGEWHYWYPNGQSRQTLRFLLADQMRILASWDSVGNPLVSNGTGRWVSTDSDGNQYGGTIRFGLPDGLWESRRPGNKQLVQTIQFDRGQARRPLLRSADAPEFSGFAAPPDYTRLLPRPEEQFDQTTGLVLGLSCDERQRKASFAMVSRNLQLPTVAVGTERYSTMVAQRLLHYGTPHWFQQLPPHPVVRCALDTSGRFVDFISAAPALREVVRAVVQHLPAWQPATFKGRPVPSYIDIVLDKTSRQVRVRPAARLRPEDAAISSATTVRP